MASSMNCNTEAGLPVTPAFRMRRSWRQIKSGQVSFEGETSDQASSCQSQHISTNGHVLDEFGEDTELFQPTPSVSDSSEQVSQMVVNSESTSSQAFSVLVYTPSQSSESVSPIFQNSGPMPSVPRLESISPIFQEKGEMVSSIFQEGSEWVSSIFKEGPELPELHSKLGDKSGEFISPFPSNTAKAADDEDPSQFAEVRHPWGVVDYHLFMSGMDRGRQLIPRGKSTILFDGDEARPFDYQEFFDTETMMGEPKLLFCALPVAERDRTVSVSFKGSHYVLGYDMMEETLFARRFDFLPKAMEVDWKDGATTYSLTIMDLATLLHCSFSEQDGRLNMGLLSCNSLCTTIGDPSDDPGMELVIAIEFCEWVVEFADLLFVGNPSQSILEELTHYTDECRLILQRASYRAWFAVRDGLTLKAYTRKHAMNQYINDLYTYDKSIEAGSLSNQDWSAPTIEDCNELREKNLNRRMEKIEKGFDELFALPDPNTPPESPGTVFAKMLSTVDKSHVESLMHPPELPRTPSPQFQYRSESQQQMSPGSPAIVASMPENYDDFEATEWHQVPLSFLLNRTLDLLKAQPELDTVESRGQFGSLLTDMGIYMRREPADECIADPQERNSGFDFEEDDWSLEVPLLLDPGIAPPPVRRLLASPKFEERLSKTM